ncbi:hypothetical protein [Dactylosporangium cerinum]
MDTYDAQWIGGALIETDRHTIYLACSWQPRHEALNLFVARKLMNEHGFLLVGDHQGYRRIPHPRGLNFRDRVDEVLGDCSGMVAILPKRDSLQTTTPNIFVEMLLAIQHGIPVLLICEEGVAIARTEEAGAVTLRFGSADGGTRRTATVSHVSPNSYDLDLIRSSDTLNVGNPMFLNRPLMLPHDPSIRDEVLGASWQRLSLALRTASYHSETRLSYSSFPATRRNPSVESLHIQC